MVKIFAPLSLAAGLFALMGCQAVAAEASGQGRKPTFTTEQLGPVGKNNVADLKLTATRNAPTKKPAKLERAIFAGGCFWCLEGRFRSINGVVGTLSGYTGGTKENPTYEEVITGKTGHAEAVLIEFDPTMVSYESLAQQFVRKLHNPTTLNRQGVDIGTQYRSAIFYTTEAQMKTALAVMEENQKRLVDPMVTELKPAPTFWPAEDYHQIYNEKTGKRPNPIEPVRLKPTGQ